MEFLVPLIKESSGGVWTAIWDAMSQRGQSTDESAASYLRDDRNNLSLGNTIVCESAGSCLGALICYREGQQNRKIHEDKNTGLLPFGLKEALQPYKELSDPNSLFISELCCAPKARGKGIGTLFLQYADSLAVQRQLPKVTLRVFARNSGAVSLYKRRGFEIAGESAVIPYPGFTYSGTVLFMSRTVLKEKPSRES